MRTGNMEIKKIDQDFSVCKVTDYSLVNLHAEYCFIGKTDDISSYIQLAYFFAELLNCTDEETARLSYRQFSLQLFSVCYYLGTSYRQEFFRTQEKFSRLRLKVVAVNYHDDCWRT